MSIRATGINQPSRNKAGYKDAADFFTKSSKTACQPGGIHIRHKNVAVVAQAAKIARTIWAVLAKDQDYQANHKSVRPQHSSAAAQEPSQDGSPTCPPRRSFVAGDARRRGQVS